MRNERGMRSQVFGSAQSTGLGEVRAPTPYSVGRATEMQCQLLLLRLTSTRRACRMQASAAQWRRESQKMLKES